MILAPPTLTDAGSNLIPTLTSATLLSSLPATVGSDWPLPLRHLGQGQLNATLAPKESITGSGTEKHDSNPHTSHALLTAWQKANSCYQQLAMLLVALAPSPVPSQPS